MLRRLSTAAVLLAVVHFAAGCAGQSRSLVRTKNVSNLEGEKIVQVKLVSGEVVRFNSNGGHLEEEYQGHTQVIVGRTESGKPGMIPLAHVQEALVERIVNKDGQIDVFSTLIITGLAVTVLANGTQR